MTQLETLIIRCAHCSDAQERAALLKDITREVAGFPAKADARPSTGRDPQKVGTPSAGTEGRPGDKETEQ